MILEVGESVENTHPQELAVLSVPLSSPL